MQRLVSQRLFGLLLGYEDVNDQIRADSVLALAVGCTDLTGEERVRERDRGIPLAGHLEPGWAFPAKPRRTGTRRSRPDRWTISSLSLDACPSPPKEIWLDVDSTDDLVHGNQEGRHFHGYYDSYCYLPLYIVWDDLVWDDLVFAVAACERRPGGGHGGGTGVWSAFASAGRRPGFAATAAFAATGRGAKTTGSTTCSACPATPVWRSASPGSCASHAAAASRPARRRGGSATSVTGPEGRGAGRGGWSRRGCRALAASTLASS